MKKYVVILLAAALVFAAGSSWAQTPVSAQESAVWYWDDLRQIWFPNPVEIADREARLFRAGYEYEGNCNKASWEIPVKTTASVAQWIDFDLAYNEFNWYVRKPGTYAGDCIEACVASNSDIGINYDGFGNLLPVDPTIGTQTPIEVWYAYEYAGVMPIGNEALWVPAVNLDADDDILADCLDLHDGICWKLWNKIKVVECNSACEYARSATITLTLENQKTWIDDNGDWALQFAL